MGRLTRASTCSHSTGPMFPLMDRCVISVLWWKPRGQGSHRLSLVPLRTEVLWTGSQAQVERLFCCIIILRTLFVFLYFYSLLSCSRALRGDRKLWKFLCSCWDCVRVHKFATHLPKSWFSVRPGCLISCLFFGYQLKCL